MQMNNKELARSLVEGASKRLDEALQSSLLKTIIPNLKKVDDYEWKRSGGLIKWDEIKDSDFVKLESYSHWDSSGKYGIVLTVLTKDITIKDNVKPPAKYSRSMPVELTVPAGTVLLMKINAYGLIDETGSRELSGARETVYNSFKVNTPKGVFKLSYKDLKYQFGGRENFEYYGMPLDELTKFSNIPLKVKRSAEKRGATALIPAEEFKKENERRYKDYLYRLKVTKVAKDRFAELLQKASSLYGKILAYDFSNSRDWHFNRRDMARNLGSQIDDVFSKIDDIDTWDMYDYDTRKIDWTAKPRVSKELDALDAMINKFEEALVKGKLDK